MTRIDDISRLVSRKLSQQLAQIFDKEVERLRRKAERLKALQEGKLTVRKIWVDAYTVPTYTVRRHQRIVTRKARR